MLSRRTVDDADLAAIARSRLALVSDLTLLRPDSDLDEPEAADAADAGDATAPVDAPGRLAAAEVAPVGRHRRRTDTAVSDAWRRWVPGTLRGRVALQPVHLSLLLVVLVVALLGCLWWVGRAQGDPPVLVTAAETREPLVGGSAGESTGSDPPEPDPWAAPGAGGVPVVDATSPSADVVVHVAGRVRRPGIVTVPAGARVADAIEAAGGVRPGTRLRGLNLARVLVDGEQIRVGLPPAPDPVGGPVPAPGPGAPGSAVAGLVNLNTATLAELETLPGIGPVTAQAILDWRTEHGRFSRVDELVEVSGIGEKTLADLAPLVTV